MNMKALSNVVTSKVGRQILTAQKHSPVMMVATGTVGVVIAGVLACRATLKVDEILREAENDKAKIEKAEALHSEKYTTEDAAQDRKLSRVKIAIGIAKLYAPAIAIGVVSIGLIAGSHIILTRRNAGLTAAYAALDKAFRGYRQRVLDDVGEEKEKEYRYDLVDKEIAVEDEHGITTNTVKVPGAGAYSEYAVCFDGGNRNWKTTWMYNQMFLNSQQCWANDKLQADGHLFLNDVYRMLGFPDSPAGAVVGWVLGNGADKVDFGVFRNGTDDVNDFLQGNERSIWLDFNVDGVVYDKI